MARGAIKVVSINGALTVTFAAASGATPAVFSDEACTTTISLPATVADGAATTFYFASPGAYTLSVKTAAGIQIAGDLNSTKVVSVYAGDVGVYSYDARLVAKDFSGDSGRHSPATDLAATYVAVDGSTPSQVKLRIPAASEWAATGRHDGLIFSAAGSQAFSAAIPDNTAVSLDYFDVKNTSANRNTGSSLYGKMIRTRVDRIDNGAGMAIVNNGSADNLYLSVCGFPDATAPQGDNAPTGIGIDYNRRDGATTESSSVFKGFGIQAYDYSTTDQGINGPVAFYFVKGSATFGNPDTEHPMVNLRGNRRMIRLELANSASGSYDGTKPVFEFTRTGDSRQNVDGDKPVQIRADGSLILGYRAADMAGLPASQLQIWKSNTDSGLMRVNGGAGFIGLSFNDPNFLMATQSASSRAAIFRGFTSQSVDILQIQDVGGTSYLSRFDKAGRIGTKVTTAPVLGDLADGDLVLATDASGNLKVYSRVSGALKSATVTVA